MAYRMAFEILEKEADEQIRYLELDAGSDPYSSTDSYYAYKK